MIKLLVELAVKQSDKLEDGNRNSGFKRENESDLAWSTSFLNAFNKISKFEMTQLSTLKSKYGDLNQLFYTCNLQPVVDKVISKNVEKVQSQPLISNTSKLDKGTVQRVRDLAIATSESNLNNNFKISQNPMLIASLSTSPARS